MNRREFNRLAVATVGGFLLPGLGGCGTMRSFNRFAGVIDYYDHLADVIGDPKLPQDDSAPAARQAALAQRRAEYRYNHDVLSPVPLLDSIPERERFSAQYTVGRAAKTGYLLPPIAQWRMTQSDEQLEDLDDFEKIFELRKKPATIGTWRTDESFAEQRLSGVNPMRLRRVRARDQMPFRLDGIPGYRDTVRNAIAAGRLYVADYTDLAFVRGGRYGSVPKHLPTPRALFYWEPADEHHAGRLMPVAIQVGPDSDVLPRDATDHRLWLMAKIAVQVADANDHEMGAHLGETHFALESFAIATARQLAPNHPLGILLRPHFQFLMVNNRLALHQLIDPGGIVDNILAGTLEESLTIATNAYKDWSVKESTFHRGLANRGLDDRDALPAYAYRDDGELVWNALHRFVSRYVGLYYRSDGEVVADTELRGWSDELASAELGRVTDMPSPITSREELIDLTTHVLFTGGPHHAAVNYPQYDYVAFVPNAPLSTYGPMPDPESPDFDRELVRWLPPATHVRLQYETMDSLTVFQWDRLGSYYHGAFGEPRALSLIADFQQELRLVERQIDERNAHRIFPYEFLKPSRIPNGASI